MRHANHIFYGPRYIVISGLTGPIIFFHLIS